MYRSRSSKSATVDTEDLESQRSTDTEPNTENQLYAEIKDLEPYTILMEEVGVATEPSAATSHQYVNVELETKRPRLSGNYQLSVCEAYGVHQAK